MKDAGDFLFCVIEGIDGSGTTTVSKLVVENLTRVSVDVVPNCAPLWTKEPGGRDEPIGLLMREALAGNVDLSEKSMLGLFLADRWEHLYRLEEWASSLGPTATPIVVCDRYVYSTWVYQQDVFPDEYLRKVQCGVFRAPDVTFVLDCPVEVAQSRKSPEKERYDDATAQENYRFRYLDLIQGENPFRVDTDEWLILVDAETNSAEAIAQYVTDYLLSFLLSNN
jgi:dTMP kinase